MARTRRGGNKQPKRPKPRLPREVIERLGKGHRWPDRKREADRTAARKPVNREEHE